VEDQKLALRVPKAREQAGDDWTPHKEVVIVQLPEALDQNSRRYLSVHEEAGEGLSAVEENRSAGRVGRPAVVDQLS
jgi:hypothetical protein